MQSRDRVFLALFFGSGAAALVYEVLWSKFLSQMFGSTIYAQTVVLATFMGGLAIGNKLFGRWADRLRRPVAAYGYLEIAIGLYAFFFPFLNSAADAVFVRLGTPIAERTALLLVLKGVLSALLLLGPTILMGGTLPLFAAWLQRSFADAGRRSARFYSVNSLGAVAGAGLAGFWLVQHFGMVLSLQLTGFVNVLIGGAAVILNRNLSALRPAPAESPADAVGKTSHPLGLACLIVALTGAASMGLQVLASRSLILIFGSSLQAFAIVLMSFILGIGLGSAWVASPKRRIRSSEAAIAVLLSAAGAWVVLIVFNIEQFTDLFRIARSGINRSSIGYFYDQLLAAGISLVVLGLPAGSIGAVLPLMIRAVAGEAAPLGARTGMLLTWNTLGAVVGTLLTGFALMPLVGLRNAFGVLALILGFIALASAWQSRWKPGMAGAGGVMILACSLFFFGKGDWQHVMSSGIFRLRENEFDPDVMRWRKENTAILFYEDGPDATVAVEQHDVRGPNSSRALRINGKADASTTLDVCTQFLLAHLPMMMKPEAKDVFVLGFGSGMTAGSLLRYPVDQIVVAENSRPVLRAAKLFEEWNYGVLDDPRTRVRAEDGRTVLKLSPQLYDVIIAEPSNPWTAGVGSVFSQEFYQIAASRLKPGGLMAQWFHAYEMHDGILTMVLRTFGSVFPWMEIWETGSGDILMLGSAEPWPSGVDVFESSFAMEDVRNDMARLGLPSPEALLARQLASQRTAFAIAGDGPIQSDLFPLLEYAAPKAFYLGRTARILTLFDERTTQVILAPTEKAAALQTLSTSTARAIFSRFGSLNPDVQACAEGKTSPQNPCIFAWGSAAPSVREIPGTSAESAAVLTEAVLALNEGDAGKALELATQVLALHPRDAQAAYISRIAERARMSQGAGE